MRRPWLLASIFLAGGVMMAGWLLMRHRPTGGKVVVQPTRLFEQVMSHVRRFGVDSLPESELYRRATNGLLGQLEDEYATLLAQGTRAGLTETPDAGGMGLLLAARDGRITVLSVLPGSPADRAGAVRGDVLFEVNNQPVDPARRDQVLGLLSGAPGSEVSLEVRRPGVGVVTLALTRGKPSDMVVQPTVQLDDKIGYIAVRLLGTGAARAVRQQVEALLAAGAQGLILDLRGSSQGALDEGIALADLFLEPGATLMELRGREPAPRRFGDDVPQDRRFARLPVVVLVDSATADASEVTAGALQDNDRALLLGYPTFGRGLSAETFPLAERVIVRISTGRWFTPVGRPIQRDTATSDTLEQRPRVSTAGGRQVYTGGGIVPDSLVRRDSLALADLALLRQIGPEFPQWQRVLRSTAAGLRLPVTPDSRARLRAAMESAAVDLPDELWELTGAIDRQIEDEIIRAGSGEEALYSRRVRRDPIVNRAANLLRTARSPTALVLGTP